MIAKKDEVPASDTLQLLLISTGCVIAIAIIKYNWNRRKLYKESWRVPGPPAIPIFGNSLSFFGHSTTGMFKVFIDWFSNYPDIFRIWMGPQLFYGVSRPEHLEIILNHPQCLQKSDHYLYMRKYMGDGLLTAPVHAWKNNRKLVNPTFNLQILSTFVEVFSEKAKILVEVLKNHVDEENLDVFRLLSACNLDTICETAMGVRVNAQTSSNRFGKLLDRAMEIVQLRMVSPWYSTEFLFNLSKYNVDLSNCVSQLQKFTDDVVVEKKKLYEEKMKGIENGDFVDQGDNKMKTFLDLLIEISDNGKKLSEQQMRDEVNTFMSAGSDTSAATLCFSFLTLAMNPKIQDRVYKEVIDVLGEDRDVIPEDLPHFHYMERCIKETLRFFPTGSMIIRQTSKDIEIDDIIMPKGSNILMFIYHTHRSPKYWKDPLKFDPDRFLPAEVNKRHPYSYLPFSGGPRNCIGSKYAMMVMKSILATVIRKYEFTTQYKSIDEVKCKLNLLLRPTEGFKVKIKLRE